MVLVRAHSFAGISVMSTALEAVAAAAEGGGRVMSEEPAAVRLFIGGLKPDVTAEMVEGRFKSFGTVESVDLRPAKSSSGVEGCVHRKLLLHCAMQSLPPWLVIRSDL